MSLYDKPKRPWWIGMLRVWLGVAAAFAIIAVIATLTACTSEPEFEPIDVPAIESEPESAPEPEPEPEPQFTVAQEQAIGLAEDYLDYTAFSRTGLIHQLEFEGFTEAEATFAVDHITVDWMEQAVKSAKSYLDYSHFSRASLINQLEFEGFTTEQAEHGATGAGL